MKLLRQGGARKPRPFPAFVASQRRLPCSFNEARCARARGVYSGQSGAPPVPSPPRTRHADTGLGSDEGQVVYSDEGVVVVGGLDVDAPIGTLVGFPDSGAEGVLFWITPAGRAYVAIISQTDGTQAGDKAALQRTAVPPAQAGTADVPTPRTSYHELTVPVGPAAVGIVDHMCRPLGGPDAGTGALPCHGAAAGVGDAGARLPLLNRQVDMGDRDVICDPLPTGVKVIDTLAPLAHGCAMLVAGPQPAAQTAVLLDAACAAAAAGTHVVYSTVAATPDVVRATHARLLAAAGGCSDRVTVVTAGPQAHLGHRFASLCAAASVGEATRDGGAASLVVADSMDCLARMWDVLSAAELIQDDADEDELVELNGMLVSAAEAERRRFFSTYIQRAAKRSQVRAGGGTMSLLLALHGVPARASGVAGEGRKVDLSAYQHVSPELKAKLAKALAAKAQQEGPGAGEGIETRIGIVEEVMSISDGQIVLDSTHPPTTDIRLDVGNSLSRLGARAYFPALRSLAPQVRFLMNQATDARRFSAADGAAAHSDDHRDALLMALMSHRPTQLTSLAELASLLLAVSTGVLDGCTPETVQGEWDAAWAAVQANASSALAEIEQRKDLTEACQQEILGACSGALRNGRQL